MFVLELMFLVIALIVGVVGSAGVAVISVDFAKFILVMALVDVAISAFVVMLRGRPPRL